MFSTLEGNWIAILLAAASNMVLGGLWYGPILGKPWMKAMGMDPNMTMTPEKKKAGNKAMLMMVPLALLSTYVLAHIVDYTASTTWYEGAECGFWLWLGFQLPLLLQGKIFEMKKNELLWINGSYQLLAILIQGAVLAVWA